MTGTPSVLADLLAECEGCGIRLALLDGGGLEIDAPQGALTPDLLARLKAHKAAILARLRPEREDESNPKRTPKKGAVCRCGATTWRDVPIHGGQSVRRECGSCGRF